MLRTHTCGELRIGDVGKEVTLGGWVDSRRDHGGLVFIDLRDRYGITQIVFEPDQAAAFEIAQTLRSEFVVLATGKVSARGEGLENPKHVTGQVEVDVTKLELLNKSKTPPFEPGSPTLPNEELRLKYRYIDLRRPQLQKAMMLRHKLTKAVRDYFDRNGFLDIETPIMGRSTPEGARDYLVPSRVHPGTFFALPQSPQLYKQLLMMAGYDRYMQIARCFRDEDLRADRQPEFTQIDVEMAFVEQEDILNTIDGLMAHLFKEIRGEELPLPLTRLTHRESLERFGNDKPDLRFGMELQDLGAVAAECAFGVFKDTIGNGGRVRGLCAKGAADKYSRKNIDELTEFVKIYGAKGLAFFKMKDGKLESSITKFFTEDQLKAIIAKFGAENGDLILCVADSNKVTSAALASLRIRLGKELNLYNPSDMKVAWLLEFPLFGWNEEEQKWDAEHHPFCQPVKEDLQYLKTDPGRVRAQSYDLVCNGYEAASGSVRIHDPDVQQQVFDFIGVSPEVAQERFGFLLDALTFGAPPHAGIALGLDRWVMMFLGNDNIREVIAFPKTQRAADLMTGAPSEVDLKQLRDLHIKTDVPKP